MAVEYWLRYGYDDAPTAIIRVLREDSRLIAQFVNKASEWETDNTMAAELSGIGGDVSWQRVSRAEAERFLQADDPSLSEPFD